MSQDVKFSQDEQGAGCGHQLHKISWYGWGAFRSYLPVKGRRRRVVVSRRRKDDSQVIKPKVAILTRFGTKMLKARPHEIAIRLSDELEGLGGKDDRTT